MNFFEFSETVFRQVLAASLSAAVLALLVWPAQLLFGKRLGAAWRHALWLLLLVRLLVPVLPESSFSLFNVPQWIRSANAAPKVTVTYSDVNPVPIESLQTETPVPFESLPSVESLEPARVTAVQSIAALWLLITSLLFLRLAVGNLWLRHRLRKTASPIDPALVHAFCETRSRMRTSWNPRLVQTSSIDSPGLFDCLRPKLLLPSGIINQLSPIELRHVLMHELAHLKRADLWTNLAMTVAHALHWFNPLVWLLLRKLRLERELACDAIALNYSQKEEQRSYGETILKLLDRIKSPAAFPAVVGILEEKQ